MTDTDSFEHPDRIGPYHVIQVLGEGGMGVVYEVEQKEPVRRRVAVKMMKVGMDTKEVVGRFDTERQALAVMEHPGIATVLDAGVNEQGRPYFVMELVHGIRLDEFCDRERLTTRQRVELFIRICEAVQHAHQKGVIHRDLKPSNVLVAEQDAHPQPKIIDFGVAKATGQRLTQHTVVTTYGQALGTLAYMSPEQAEMGGLDVDTRTDVYSLAVMLYELLTGNVPVDPKALHGAVFLALLIERDRTVPTLSGRFTKLDRGQQDRLAKLRGTDPQSLKKKLAGDLQWIVFKAIEKDRSRRYETASELAMDLKRYLADEPVSARPPSSTYRLGKFVTRNRWPVAVAGTLTAALLLGLAGTSLGLIRARAAEVRAEQQTATADLTLEYMIGMFGGSDPTLGGSADVTAREILDASISRIDTLASQPLVQARLLQAMGAVYTNLGLYDQADTLLRQSLTVHREVVGEGDPALERSLRQLAWLYLNEGRLTDALPLAEEAASIAELAYEPLSSLLADAILVLGVIHRDLANYEEARGHLDRSLEIREQVFGPDHIETAWGLFHLAWLEQLHGDDEAARAIYRRVLPIYSAEYGDDHLITATVLNDYAGALSDDPATADSALALYQRVVGIRKESYGPNHAAVGDALGNVGTVYHRMGDLELAKDYYGLALAVYEEAYSSDNADVARTYYNIGEVSIDLAEYDRAEASYLRALEATEIALGVAHPLYGQTLRGLAAVLRSTGRVDEAEQLEARADSLESV